MRTGFAHLPLHGGKAPSWLFTRMRRLAREIISVFISEFGAEKLLGRISDPYWFQAFGCVLGFDWHSSGLTTTVCGAMKEGVRGIESDLGFYACGGKGGTSRKTPDEIKSFCEKVGFDAESLVYSSRMSAKVDSAALQDGYELYHHSFFFTKSGAWTVVQQGMNTETHYARRYHWLGEKVENYVCEPHNAICSQETHTVLNMVAAESEDSRRTAVCISQERPDKILKEAERCLSLELPRRHYLLGEDFSRERLKKILLSTYEEQPVNFEKLLGIKGVGPKTVRALALIAELLYGAKPSFRDPARFSFAHGGKDGIPYPVDRKLYDESIEYLRKCVGKGRIDLSEKEKALKRLARF